MSEHKAASAVVQNIKLSTNENVKSIEILYRLSAHFGNDTLPRPLACK